MTHWNGPTPTPDDLIDVKDKLGLVVKIEGNKCFYHPARIEPCTNKIRRNKKKLKSVAILRCSVVPTPKQIAKRAADVKRSHIEKKKQDNGPT